MNQYCSLELSLAKKISVTSRKDHLSYIEIPSFDFERIDP